MKIFWYLLITTVRKRAIRCNRSLPVWIYSICTFQLWEQPQYYLQFNYYFSTWWAVFWGFGRKRSLKHLLLGHRRPFGGWRCFPWAPETAPAVNWHIMTTVTLVIQEQLDPCKHSNNSVPAFQTLYFPYIK